MSQLLWIDTEKDQAIELGNGLLLLEEFAHMARVCGDEYEEFADLFGVPEATMDQEDVDPEWLADVRKQASEFLTRYGTSLNGTTKSILNELVSSTGESDPTPDGEE